MRRQRRKLFVRQPKIVRHESSPPCGLESRQITRFNWVQTLSQPAFGQLASVSSATSLAHVYRKPGTSEKRRLKRSDMSDARMKAGRPTCSLIKTQKTASTIMAKSRLRAYTTGGVRAGVQQ
jgi:hypothetical protein